MEKLPWVEAALAGEEQIAGSKVTSLFAAVAGLVGPGDSLQIGSGLGYPMALLNEIIRLFWEARPGVGPGLLHNPGRGRRFSPGCLAGLLQLAPSRPGALLHPLI